MKTAIVLLLCSSIAFAQAVPTPDVPLDAPLLLEVQPYAFIKDLPPKGRVLELGAGEIVPFEATCLDKPQAKREAKISKYFREEATDLKENNVVMSKPVFYGLVGGGLATFLALGIAIGYAAARR